MAKILEQEKARRLRKEGESIKRIAQKLDLSSSSVSYWCRDIILTSEQVDRLQQRQRGEALKAVLKYGEKKRALRIEKEKTLAETGKNDVGKLNRRELFLVGLALYWGEGYKSGNGELGFTNSNPDMIRFILKWFQDIFGIAKKDFILRVSVNSQHSSRVEVIQKFWSDTTGVPLSQFSKISLIKVSARKIYTNTNQHWGTLRVKVRRGTDLRRRILGSIEAFKSFENLS